jgi:hypothetical protein
MSHLGPKLVAPNLKQSFFLKVLLTLVLALQEFIGVTLIFTRYTKCIVYEAILLMIAFQSSVKCVLKFTQETLNSLPSLPPSLLHHIKLDPT